VDLPKAEFEVGRSKTERGTGRIIPLHQTAIQAFKNWKTRWPNAQPRDFVFPSEKLRFKGEGAADKGIMTPYDTDLTKPIGSLSRACSRPRNNHTTTLGLIEGPHKSPHNGKNFDFV
jgi:integrase